MSITHHQTLLGRTLYDHFVLDSDYNFSADGSSGFNRLLCTVPAVAASSSSIHNSSLGPNLLALMELNQKHSLPLFDNFFLCNNCDSSSPSTLQFTHSLSIFITKADYSEFIIPFISRLVTNHRYFTSSLKSLVVVLSLAKEKRELPQQQSIMEAFAHKEMPALNALTIHAFDSPMRSSILHAVRCFPNCTSLNFSRSHAFDNACLHLLVNSSCSSKIKSLNLARCDRFNFKKCFDETTATALSSLTTLNLSHCSDSIEIKHFSNHTRNSLTSLNVSHCHLGDENLRGLEDLVNLRKLDISSNHMITDQGVEQLISLSLVKLEVLDLSFCFELTATCLDKSKMVHLIHLIWQDCDERSPKVIASALNNHPDLTHIDFSYMERFNTKEFIRSIRENVPEDRRMSLEILELNRESRFKEEEIEELSTKLLPRTEIVW